jgi:hypothetical protein
MGSYVSQVDYEDRWKIVHYVRTLQGGAETPSDSVTTDSATVNLNPPVADEAPGPIKDKKDKGH